MIGERAVLGRVKHFEQRGCWVPAKVRADLIQFIQQNYRVAAFGAAQRLNDAPGKRANVSPAVAANLGLIPHAAEGDSRKFTAQRVGHTTPQGSLADTGRPDQAKNRSFDLLATLVDLYEKKAYPIDEPDPLEAIRFRMEQQGLKPRDLVPYIGSKSKVSEVLSGRRGLSLNMIRGLSSGLGIPAAVLVRETPAVYKVKPSRRRAGATPLSRHSRGAR